MKLKYNGIAFLITFLFFMNVAGASIIQNGSFEDGTYPGGQFETLSYGATNLSYWTVGGDSIDWIYSYWSPSDGSYSLDLSGQGSGSISQTFETVEGQQYKVLFDMAGNPDNTDKLKDLRVTAAGTSTEYTFNATGKTKTDMGWVQNLFLFTADSTSTTLTFLSLEDNAYGPALDNVRLSAIPIPGAVWLFGSGLIGLVGIRRKMKK